VGDEPDEERERGLEQQHDREAAVQLAAPRPVEEERARGRPDDERGEAGQAQQREVERAEHEAVGEHRGQPRHVRGVERDRHEADRVEDAGREREQHGEIAVPASRAVGSRDAPEVGDEGRGPSARAPRRIHDPEASAGRERAGAADARR
jgi:hypothetical protein